MQEYSQCLFFDPLKVNPQQRAFEYGRFYYDEEHQRLARKENVTANGTDYVYGEIFLHEEVSFVALHCIRRHS